MGLILLIPGLILLLVDANWFDGQNTVGLVLTVIGGVLVLLQVLWFAIAGLVVRKKFKEHDALRDTRRRRSTL